MGNEDDGYICSSTWMKNSYKRRPQDFKRRILARVNNGEELREEEAKWISLIKDEELGKKYYNLTKKVFGYWFLDESKYENTKQRISKSLKEGQNPNILKTDPEIKQKYIDGANKQFSDPANREAVKQQMLSKWQDPEYKKMQSEAHSKPRPNRQGKPMSKVYNKYGYKGISFERGKYVAKATIPLSNKKMYLGRFNTAEEAGKAVQNYERNELENV